VQQIAEGLNGKHLDVEVLCFQSKTKKINNHTRYRREKRSRCFDRFSWEKL